MYVMIDVHLFNQKNHHLGSNNYETTLTDRTIPIFKEFAYRSSPFLVLTCSTKFAYLQKIR
jgi:hypothetical protein